MSQGSSKYHIWSTPKLYDCLLKVLHLQQRLVYIFIDGLDEHTGDMGQLLGCCEQLRAPPNVRICTSSRFEGIMVRRFRQIPQLRMQDLNFRATLKFADDHLSPLIGNGDFARTIATRSEGVFLWTVFATRIVA